MTLEVTDSARRLDPELASCSEAIGKVVADTVARHYISLQSLVLRADLVDEETETPEGLVLDVYVAPGGSRFLFWDALTYALADYAGLTVMVHVQGEEVVCDHCGGRGREPRASGGTHLTATEDRCDWCTGTGRVKKAAAPTLWERLSMT